MSGKISLPDEIREIAEALEIQWPIECRPAPEQVLNTLFVQTLSKKEEKHHEIILYDEILKESILNSMSVWMYALCRLSLAENFGTAIGNSTHKVGDPLLSVPIIWISDVWVFDLMKSKMKNFAGTTSWTITENLLDKYKEIKPKPNTFATFDVLRWMAIVDRILGRTDNFSGRAVNMILESSSLDQDCGYNDVLRAHWLYKIIRHMDYLAPGPIFAYSQFEESARILFSLVNCSYIPSLDIKSGEWTFSNVE